MNRRTLSLLVFAALALGAVALFLRPVASQAPPKKSRVVDAGAFPSLQAAIDALPDEGGIVRIPPGTFHLKEPLVLSRENTKIVGAGVGTVIANRNEEGQPALVLRPEDTPQKKKSRIWGMHVAHLRITGNPKSGDGILAERINEIFLIGMTVDHHGRHGINLVGCYENPRITQCNLTYNAQAGLNLQGCHDIVVSANEFEENLDALRCLDGFNLCMNGNNIDDHLQHGVVIENTYGSVVAGNMIEECKGVAVVIDRDCYGITVGSNVIAHNFSGGVDIRDGWGCAVSANTFTIVAKHALRVGPDAGRISITGNNFSNSYIGAGKVRREVDTGGIFLDGAADVAVTGNVFAGLNRPAVDTAAPCQRLALVGNVVADTSRLAGTSQAPLNLGKAPDVEMAHNVIEKASE